MRGSKSRVMQPAKILDNVIGRVLIGRSDSLECIAKTEQTTPTSNDD
jgi:hypothetical protein